MKNKLRYRFAAILLFSILIYAIPFHIGEYTLRIVLAILVILLLINTVRLILKEENKSIRNYLLLLILNSIVMFHLGLIFSYLMFNATTTLLIGVILGAGLYYTIIKNIKQIIV